MYLKSIEIHGFKSFANRILFDFTDGVTGIVGPNGSGKSNVADAVRWVLGEQSARILRGANMQDVIFSGTENRRALSYAYVALTLDNSDKVLAIEYPEVTVARRVYRSGESEYLLNGNVCRLKDVNELFYDTGIGKEGYSIIGQGQIDTIVSGKPEERRELFDEAAGIVKFKRRKAAAIKKLENEHENLDRVNDILKELEVRVEPLREQSDKAKEYLKKKDEQKVLDINAFLIDMESAEKQDAELLEKQNIAKQQYDDVNAEKLENEKRFTALQDQIKELDESIESSREALTASVREKEHIEGEINILNEQINASSVSNEHFKRRLGEIEELINSKKAQMDSYKNEAKEANDKVSLVSDEKSEIEAGIKAIRDEIASFNTGIDTGKSRLLELMDLRGSIRSEIQRTKTLTEQLNIKKAEINRDLITASGRVEELKKSFEEKKEILQKTMDDNLKLSDNLKSTESRLSEQNEKKKTIEKEIAEFSADLSKAQAKFETLSALSERYEGYGATIKRVMEKKSQFKGIDGVVADLLQVDKKYETAIETSLGGNVQNIVTEDEATAKGLIEFLKQNKAGRATFLPVTSVKGKEKPFPEDVLKEKGVIGSAASLIVNDKKYDGVFSYLLGRVIVCEHIDNALALAKKYKYSLHIVTLEGEYLSPGGSIAGGSFKNQNNLLGRKRELEELEETIKTINAEIGKKREKLVDIDTAIELNEADVKELRSSMRESFEKLNEAKLSFDKADAALKEEESKNNDNKSELESIEAELLKLKNEKTDANEKLKTITEEEKTIGENSEGIKQKLSEKREEEDKLSAVFSEKQLEEASVLQQLGFINENIRRLEGEIKRLGEETDAANEGILRENRETENKKNTIEELKLKSKECDEKYQNTEKLIKDSVDKKDVLSKENREFYQITDDISKRLVTVEKEMLRLNALKERIKENRDSQSAYIWNEYELTFHNAKELRNPELTDATKLRRESYRIRDEIKALGTVNVNAIDEYKEVNERYTFLKTQHDDIVAAEEVLEDIIEELDRDMRKQFTEKFAEIESQFNSVFKELFGGGKGTLELALEEDTDILDAGIRIIAQPPGKKLSNMMQLSGGEKTLTAIALLFAIQNLKPSPFCLLDEIEAALDDPNVERFAKYLHRLSNNTQFIIITHRRGTMNAADRLYGITMQERGVSALVSVSLIEGDLDE